jgi:hypothetical protein
MASHLDDDTDRESKLDRDAERELATPAIYRRQRIARVLNSGGSLKALLLERTEPEVNAAGVMNAWRPSDRSEP